MGLAAVQDRPALFSTFLMWLLADLFGDLPEVGDVEQPKLVFFLDEAHLLFDDASEAFLDAIARTVRLIRSKGVGVFFVTQTPKDVPSEVLAQLGNRVQHALRAFTPDDAKALKATVSTFPRSEAYDVSALLTSMGTGEAAVTILSERGAPTPVVWTRLRPPASLMAPLDPAEHARIVRASPLLAEYGTPVDRDSAYERLLAKVTPPEEPEPGRAPARPRARAPRDEPSRCRRSWGAASSAASRAQRPARPVGRSAVRCSGRHLAAGHGPGGAGDRGVAPAEHAVRTVTTRDGTGGPRGRGPRRPRGGPRPGGRPGRAGEGGGAPGAVAPARRRRARRTAPGPARRRPRQRAEAGVGARAAPDVHRLGTPRKRGGHPCGTPAAYGA
jgi:hypothetical protein